MKKFFLLVLVVIAIGLVYQLWLMMSINRHTTRPTTTIDNPYPTEIQIDDMVPGSSVRSPLLVHGRARGSWYFEATFPVLITQVDGTVITATFARATADWMTDNFVPYTVSVAFTVATPTPAFVVLKNDNPSGDPAKQKIVRIPVTLQP